MMNTPNQLWATLSFHLNLVELFLKLHLLRILLWAISISILARPLIRMWLALIVSLRWILLDNTSILTL